MLSLNDFRSKKATALTSGAAVKIQEVVEGAGTVVPGTGMVPFPVPHLLRKMAEFIWLSWEILDLLLTPGQHLLSC